MATLDLMHAWCRANGISVSWCIDSQLAAKDALSQLLMIGNSAAVYSGDELKVIPYDEVSSVGNGEIYIAPTASGPIANLTLADIVYEKGSLPIQVFRKKRTDCDNVVAIEFIDRSIDYAHNAISGLDQRSVAQNGPRKGGVLEVADLGNKPPMGSLSLLQIHSADVAQKLASILAKRSAAGANRYSFTVTANFFWIEAMDLITIPDKYGFGSGTLAVRLLSVKETEHKTYQVEAERFIYGLNHPDVKNTTAATGTLVSVSVDPGLVNTPVIFEPPTGMLGGGNAQLWFLVSGADPNYGGCLAYVSVDGGLTYAALGNIGPATTGQLTADYADSASDPDTTHQLKVDLTESNGELDSESQEIADGFADPCYVGTNNSPADTNFEVVCPTVATLTGANAYTMDTYIRRAVQGTSHMDHATGSRFGVLDSATFKVDIPSQWFGKTLHFKFPAYNKLGGQMNDLADCTDYTITLTGSYLPGGFYVNGS